MPDDLFPDKDKNTAKTKRSPRRWSVIIIEFLLVAAAAIAVYRFATNGQDRTPEPSLDAAKQYEWGVIHQKEGAHEDAITAFTSAIEQGYTPIGRAYYERAQSHYALEHYDEAIADYTQSITLTPACEDCYFDYRERGNAYWMQGNYDAAFADFTQAIDINARYFAAYVSRAELSRTYFDTEDALEDIQLGLSASAGDVVERGLANGQERSVKFDEAAQQYHFSFPATVGDDLSLTITRATLDVVIVLLNEDGDVLTYDDSEGSQGGDALNYVIEETGDYTLAIAAYNTTSTGEVTLSMLSTNPDEESLVPDAPRIDLDNVKELAVADTVKNQSAGDRTIATSGMLFIEKNDEQLIIYDLRDQPIGYSTIEVPSELAWGVAVSDDGELAALGINRTLMLYNVRTGDLEQQIKLGDAYPSALAFSSDSMMIAVVAFDEVMVYDALSGSELYDFVMKERRHGESVVFSHDGTLLAVGQDGGQIHLWDLEQERLIRTLETGKVETITALAFDANAESVAAGGEARRVQVWRVASGTLIDQYAVHTRQITDLAFSPDGRILASASEDGFVYLWSREHDMTTPYAILPHDKPVDAIEFQADGRTLLTAADDYKLRFWRVKE